LLFFSLLAAARGAAYPWPDDRTEPLDILIEQALELRVESATQETVQDDLEVTLIETVEDAVDESIESSVESEIDTQVDGAVEDAIESAVLDDIEEAVASSAEDAIVEGTEAQIESAVEEQLSLAVAEAAESGAEELIEELATESAESASEEAVAAAVEASVEDQIAAQVDDAVNPALEAEVESAVEDQIQAAVAQAAEESAEQAVEANVEVAVAQATQASVEQAVEANVEAAVAQAAEESVEQTVEAAVEVATEQAMEPALEDIAESRFEEQLALVLDQRLEATVDEVVDDLETVLEVEESRVLREQWLVMAEPKVFDELLDRGYLFDTVTDLPGLGLRLAEVAAPSSFDIREVRDGVMDIVGKDRASVDLNHIYTAGVPSEAMPSEGTPPTVALPMPGGFNGLGARVGIIDSAVDTAHPAFAASDIEARSFLPRKARAPAAHGTAIASIIAANSPQYVGLMPNARLYAASVFREDDELGSIADTVSLIRALDWLIAADVEVINVSLAGPPNSLLEKALSRAAVRNTVIMAAAGNGGPMAKPMYPAAYESVVAVTALDASDRIFRLANRGDYLALAAPGVDVLHAAEGGGYRASSGTSFAVPFAVAAAVRLKATEPDIDVVAGLIDMARDLGTPGHDQVYGYGALRVSGL
jgi:subtilisin family serine protease